jgi:hypothetical protein
MFDKLDSALRAGLSKAVFDHIRNYMMCAFVLAVGTHELTQKTSLLFGLVPNDASGIGVIAIASVLILLNLYDGIRQIIGLRYHTMMIAGLIAIYAFLSVRVVEVAWHFRAM